MDREQLKTELIALAERCKGTHPLVTSVLYTCAAAVTMGQEIGLSQVTATWTREAIIQGDAAEGHRNKGMQA